ncbi:hypothetical protein MKK88_18775 [Methylobacterium sp. E-005]|uniref:hypothetical protein n=1 Tax=Methylobacterium sp. E-005 TaxID=2836549 RepID=UPI001FBAE7A4|nr:hypothetical protein [Methylobacterium sp. E-005]MCJ2088011.1 hypothetical protein [Methylobacterium sp. E-005]
MNEDLRRLKQLAGIKEDQSDSKVVVLLPRRPAEQMRQLLDNLKEICGDPSAWHQIEIDGQIYIATGVERDL